MERLEPNYGDRNAFGFFNDVTSGCGKKFYVESEIFLGILLPINWTNMVELCKIDMFCRKIIV